MKFIITGDLVVTDDVECHNLIGHGIKEYFSTADYRISNLEAPVTNSIPRNRIIKTGPHLRTNAQSVLPTLKNLKINLLTLANNHILDYGEDGLNDTIEFCINSNIDWTGVGVDLFCANKAKRIVINNIKVSIINFAENEWSSATEKNAGANPMDLIENTKLIKKEKEGADFVFVIVHGGHEHYSLPSPRMQKQYRFYADSGADLVVGHHTHCISGFELYEDVPIYYSLGNFLFTLESKHDSWYKGICLEIVIDSNKELTTKPIFVGQNHESYSLELLQGDSLAKTNERFVRCSSIIKNPRNLAEHWNDYLSEVSERYLKIWSPYSFIENRYVKALFSRLGIRFESNKARAVYLNNMRCEAHYELSKEVLDAKIRKD